LRSFGFFFVGDVTIGVGFAFFWMTYRALGADATNPFRGDKLICCFWAITFEPETLGSRSRAL